jgi:quercetin dioxygenase-like cupin family protein
LSGEAPVLMHQTVVVDRPPTAPAAALVVRAGQGQHIAAAGVEHLFALTSSETSGRFALEHFTVPPSVVGARGHVHGSHDEYFYVLEGQLTVLTDEGETILEAGDVAAAPRGSLHGFRNADGVSAVRVLCMYTPAGYEGYFRDVHAASRAGLEITDALLAELRGRYDTESR